VRPSGSVDALRGQIAELTGVPASSQKLMCPRAWKGALKDTALPADLAPPAGQTELTVMLIGSADAALVAPNEPMVFVEDLPEEEAGKMDAEREAELIAAAEGDIAVAQKVPVERCDGRTERFRYNPLVTGLPQQQIEDALRRRRERGEMLGDCCVMQLGLELAPAYVCALAVLADGCVVNGRENGRIEAWRRCERLFEAVHGAGAPVSCLTAAPPAARQAWVFASGGAGVVKLWNASGNVVQAFPV